MSENPADDRISLPSLPLAPTTRGGHGSSAGESSSSKPTSPAASSSVSSGGGGGGGGGGVDYPPPHDADETDSTPVTRMKMQAQVHDDEAAVAAKPFSSAPAPAAPVVASVAASVAPPHAPELHDAATSPLISHETNGTAVVAEEESHPSPVVVVPIVSMEDMRDDDGGGGAAASGGGDASDTSEVYLQVFQTLAKRTDAWAGVYEEVQMWIQEMIAHEKANAAALKKLPAIVTSIDPNQTKNRTAVHSISSVVACVCTKEATHRLTLAKQVNVDTGMKIANLIQDAQKRARSVREKGEQLSTDLHATRTRLKEISQRHRDAQVFVRTVGDSSHTSVAPADPWLAERQMEGEHKVEADICKRISEEATRECLQIKEGEAQRAVQLRATWLKYLQTRKQVLQAMLQDVDAAVHAVEDVDAEGDWRNFVSRFPILDEFKSIPLEPTTAKEPESQRVGAVCRSGRLRRQGKLYGTSDRFFVLSKHGYLHEFLAESSLNPEASFPLIPGRFDVSTVTPESFEFCYRLSTAEQQQKGGLFGLFGATEVRMVLVAADKEDMLAWLTSIHDFSLRRDYVVVEKTSAAQQQQQQLSPPPRVALQAPGAVEKA